MFRQITTALAALFIIATATACVARPSQTVPGGTDLVGPRWSGALLPRGQPSISGNAVVSPASGTSETVAVISIQGPPSARAVLPWGIYEGACGSSGRVLGSAAAYPLIQMRADGTGQATAMLPIEVPTVGTYHARVQLAPPQAGVVACGELRNGAR